jgi:hypothetical protein
MRRVFSFAVLAGILTILPGAQGADLTGTWKGAFDFQGKNVPLTFHLTEAGGAVTGNVEGLPTTPADIHEGRIEGDKLTFWASSDYQGQTYKLVFTGQVAGATNEISFTLGTDDGSWSAGLTARKSTDTGVSSPDPTKPDVTGPDPTMPAAAGPNPSGPDPAGTDVTGTWKGSFDLEEAKVPVTLHLTSTGGVVTGTIEGMMEGSAEKPVEIQDGKLAGTTLTFWIDTEYQGETYKIVYKGTLADGKIQLGFGTEDGSWSNELTVTK